ncbi:hypothetical protein H0H81_001922 [Sphagnurus paluster]|uniref:Uncharacterized protein n=1 Tax=Sphagnurus paluster TaxID=117069 RepID=A0A9P7FXC0_9AGAR|nr:hypothetical protein H0H81_001922 [Sphagnurus paluster]
MLVLKKLSWRSGFLAKRRRVSTLCAELLRRDDYIDVSNIRTPCLFSAPCTYGGKAPFPPNTKGFFYFYHSPYPQDPGELRFRLTPSPNPASFFAGTDLLRPEGFPWCIKLPSIAGQPTYAKLRDFLLADGIVSHETMKRSAAIGIVRRGPFQLYTLSQPLFVDMFVDRTISVISGTTKQSVRFPRLFVDQRLTGDSGKERLPYEGTSPYFVYTIIHRRRRGAGSAMVRLELGRRYASATPDVHVRVLKLMSPVKCLIPGYDGYLHPPQPGELLQKGLAHRVRAIKVGPRTYSQPWLDLIRQAQEDPQEIGLDMNHI